jgi:4'-phosphopantetheinyl transferase EntD
VALDLQVPEGLAPRTAIESRPVRRPHGPAEQFAAGREAAAAALAAAGCAARTVPREPDGRPRFPQGFAGSISHTDRWAVALVVPGAQAVGVDIEATQISPRVAAFVLREQERELLLEAGRYTARDLFAAKEAAFKALNGPGDRGGPLFWRIGLQQVDGVLIATSGGTSVPVRVRPSTELSFAVAVRR